MTDKQKRFADEYLIDCNATRAAIRAGYSKKTARQAGQRMLTNVDIKTYIDEKIELIHTENIADATEVMTYLTSVLRGETVSEVLVVEGKGDGYSEARLMKKNPDEKEKLKAAELIGKRYRMFTDKVELSDQLTIVFNGEDEIPE